MKHEKELIQLLAPLITLNNKDINNYKKVEKYMLTSPKEISLKIIKLLEDTELSKKLNLKKLQYKIETLYSNLMFDENDKTDKISLKTANILVPIFEEKTGAKNIFSSLPGPLSIFVNKVLLQIYPLEDIYLFIFYVLVDSTLEVLKRHDLIEQKFEEFRTKFNLKYH
jgi:hypothetical protein